METAYLIGIGRNVKNEPMLDHRWEDFKNALRAAIDSVLPRHARPTRQLFAGSGLGQWEGKIEQSVQVIVQLSTTQAARLRNALADLAFLYDQEAIALTPLTQTEFIAPTLTPKARGLCKGHKYNPFVCAQW